MCPPGVLCCQPERVITRPPCGLCHLYNLKGRVPGESSTEVPAVAILDANYLKTLDANGGMTPSLISDAFFRKWRDQKAFADRVANATGAFPPKGYVKGDSEVQIAAYILYTRCGKLPAGTSHTAGAN